MALAAVVMTACGSSSNAGGGAAAQPAQGTSSPAGSQGGATADGTARGPAASGKIAALNGHTMQVQSQQAGQVAVTWKSSTTFRQTVTMSASKITKGDCVVAVADSGSNAQSSKITAGTITVSKPTNGTCTAGFAGGSRPGGFPSRGNFPSGGAFPSTGNFPSGAARSAFPGGAARSGSPGGTGGFTAGQVQSVSGETLTVRARQFGASGTTTRTVVIDAKTSVRTQASTTANALHVGKCVTATGKTDSSGTVAARTVSVSDPTNGQCGGFGAFGGGNG
jgi:hypothetical protein